MDTIILKPTDCSQGYDEAAKIFKNLYKKVTDNDLEIREEDDGFSDLIVIGSDAVNDFLMNEVLNLKIEDLGIRYGTDDYCIYTYKSDTRRILLLSGGRERSTIYAVYDYFERYANCHYFWDGDVIPHCDNLPMEDISIIEKPQFFYRGLRYFAHRGLKRFQAEHWSFDDWKKEIDWMVKKRLNFFMLRIGMDDIWQRAFPDDVPYPEDYRTIKDEDAFAYNDRSDFWTLKYRSELREKILEYARKLDLMFPADCGTMTHWYSRTPVEFLENRKPTFINQSGSAYVNSDTGRVFDFTKKTNMDYYMKLTKASVETYEKNTELFHTIGLGERILYEDKNKNFKLKLIAYRRIAENIRRMYPNSKLMLASWDFYGWWEGKDVQKLIKELDPERTIILDYTSDVNTPSHSFLSWDIIGKFPWIFGIFHAYASESELRGPYSRIEERLKIAANDKFCKGMILWPELSHSDALMLEFFTQNAWSPLSYSTEQLINRFCKNRYGIYEKNMNDCWQNVFEFIKLNDWGGVLHTNPEKSESVERIQGWLSNHDLWVNCADFLSGEEIKSKMLHKFFISQAKKTCELKDNILYAFDSILKIRDALNDEFVMRDCIDIVRTVLGRCMNYLLIIAMQNIENKVLIEIIRKYYLETLSIMQELLYLNDDFSIYKTLQGLKETAPVNPNFEITLKRNIANSYCRQPAFELVGELFIPEGELVLNWFLKAEKDDKCDFSRQRKEILDLFMKKPLSKMQPTFTPNAFEVIQHARNTFKQICDFFKENII